MAGFLPLRSQSSGTWNDGADQFYIPASDTSPMAIGDPVVLTGSASTEGFSSIGQAPANGSVFGVIVGFRPTPSIVANGYRLAGTEAFAIVEHDPDTLFEVVADANTIVANDVGLNVNFNASAPTSKVSTATIAAATKATTATLPFRIVSFSQRVGSRLGDPQPLLYVALNKTTDASGTAGV